MDLGKLVSPDKPFKLEITLNGRPVGVSVMVLSADSEAVRAVGRAHADAALTGKAKPSAQMIEDEGADKLLACIHSWDWQGNSWNGEVVGPYDKDVARKILTSSEGAWIAEQIGGAASDRANFTGKNAKP